MSASINLSTRQGDRIAIVAGLRTPFAKQATEFHGVSALDLGKLVVNELLIRSELDVKLVEQLVYGQVVQMPEAPNIAREIVLGTGMNVQTDAFSVSRACATSFQSVVSVAESMLAGISHIAIAGGARCVGRALHIVAGQGAMLTPTPFDLQLVVMGDNQVALDAVCCTIIGVVLTLF